MTHRTAFPRTPARGADPRGIFAGARGGVPWRALSLRVVAITTPTSGPKPSRRARLGSSRAEDDPIKAISYRDSRLFHARSAGVDGRPVTLSQVATTPNSQQPYRKGPSESCAFFAPLESEHKRRSLRCPDGFLRIIHPQECIRVARFYRPRIGGGDRCDRRADAVPSSRYERGPDVLSSCSRQPLAPVSAAGRTE